MNLLPGALLVLASALHDACYFWKISAQKVIEFYRNFKTKLKFVKYFFYRHLTYNIGTIRLFMRSLCKLILSLHAMKRKFNIFDFIIKSSKRLTSIIFNCYEKHLHIVISKAVCIAYAMLPKEKRWVIKNIHWTQRGLFNRLYTVRQSSETGQLLRVGDTSTYLGFQYFESLTVWFYILQ